MRLRAALAVACAVLLLLACANPPDRPGPAPIGVQPAPEAFPAAYYREAQARGRAVFRVVPAESLVLIEVGRTGSLARLGHDHIVASRDVQGFILPEAGRADLYVPVQTLSVDDAALRQQAGMDTRLTPGDIEGTRRNMLSVLEAGRYPHVFLRVKSAQEKAIDVELELHGVARRFTVPAAIERSPESITVSGSFGFAQSDFGIAPFSILGGAIQVRDRLDLRFRITAVRMR